MPYVLTIELGGVDITASVPLESVRMQLAGSQETATCEFDIEDFTLTVAAAEEDLVTVTEVGTSEVLFGGFVRSLTPDVAATGRTVHIKAVDYNSLLDRQLIIRDTRSAGESDKVRLEYLMTTYGDQFSPDFTQITTLAASMPEQTFTAITLRQAIERVLGQASTLSAYHIDPTGRLVTYDRSVITPGPFDVVVGTPGAGQIAVDKFRIDFDSTGLANAVYIVGATAAGSGWFTDPTSIAAYGRRERFFNAPDSDTSAKAAQVGAAVLQDQAYPIPRGSFETDSPNDGWRIGQHITCTSAQHGITAETYRIARVTVRYLNGLGHRRYTLEIGSPLPTLTALLAKRAGGGSGIGITPGGGGWSGPWQYDGSALFGGSECGCSPCCEPWDGIGSPEPGDEVQNELVFTGDGTTVAGVTLYPYSAGTLRVWVAGLNAAGYLTETNPATGAFDLDFAPTAGQTVRANYTAA